MTNEVVKRSIDVADASVELRNDDGVKRIRGYASLFDTPSKNPLWNTGTGRVREVIGRSAFNKTLQENQHIKALVNHNDDKVLASRSSGTLQLNNDEKGLYFEITPAEELRSYEKDLLISMERGDVTGCSFAFQPVKYHDEERSGENVRVIDELKLKEVSVVAFPAYGEAGADYRSESNDHSDDVIEKDNNDQERQEPESTEAIETSDSLEDTEDRSQPEVTHDDQPSENTDQVRAYWEALTQLQK